MSASAAAAAIEWIMFLLCCYLMMVMKAIQFKKKQKSLLYSTRLRKTENKGYTREREWSLLVAILFIKRDERKYIQQMNCHPPFLSL